MPELSTLTHVIADAVEPYLEAQPAVLSRSLATPLLTTTLGDRYIIPVGAVGAWANRTNQVAEWTTTGWTFLVPSVGMSAWVADERIALYFDGADWIHEAVSGQTAALSNANKRMPARTTAADGDLACDIALAASPAGSIAVCVNGITIPEVGDATKVAAACFFSTDGQAALALAGLQAGAKLYWNGSVAGYELDNATDIIEFVYEIA